MVSNRNLQTSSGNPIFFSVRKTVRCLGRPSQPPITPTREVEVKRLEATAMVEVERLKQHGSTSRVRIWVMVSNVFYFHPLFGEDSHFDEHIFQLGWNHQLGIHEENKTQRSVALCAMVKRTVEEYNQTEREKIAAMAETQQANIAAEVKKAELEAQRPRSIATYWLLLLLYIDRSRRFRSQGHLTGSSLGRSFSMARVAMLFLLLRSFWTSNSTSSNGALGHHEMILVQSHPFFGEIKLDAFFLFTLPPTIMEAKNGSFPIVVTFQI